MSDYAYPTTPPKPSKIANRADVGNLLARRWAACWIDLIVVAVIFFIPLGLFTALGLDTTGGSGGMAAGIIGLIVALAYYPLTETLWGQTLGKLLLGIIVVTDNGRPPNIFRSLLRTLLRLVEVNPFLAGGVPAGLIVLITPNRQRLGDLLAGTYVVPKKDVTRIADPKQTAVVFD
jgi:uncharacterized RDD family membrane protein YckC